jgi:lysophospholipase L1-like esterase
MSDRTRGSLAAFATVAIVVLLTGLGVEVGFRVAPGLIPESLLKRFESHVRLEIAKRRFLPNESQTWVPVRSDDGPPIKLFQPGSEIEWDFPDTGERGRTRMDDLGFCNAPEDDPNRDHIAIIAVGDSFTACHAPAPAKSWPSLLGRALGTSAYNLGRGGYGPYEYLQLLRLFGLAKHPDYVVMQIYEGNDLRDAARYYDYVAASPAERRLFLDRAGWNPLRFEPARWLDNPVGRHSYAYDFAVVGSAAGLSSLVDSLAREPGRKIDFHYAVNLPTGRVAMNTQNNDQDEVRAARDLAAGRLQATLYDGAVDGFAALAREHGFVPVLAYAPAAYTAYAEFVEFADPSLANLMTAFSRTQREHLRARAAADGLVFVDLTPALQAAVREPGQRELLYFPINVHYAPAGQQVVADAIAAAIRAHPHR